MKQAMLFFALVLGAASVAKADIPPPHCPPHCANNTDSSTYTYSGERAAAKWAAITSRAIPGSSSGWSGESESFKVDRSSDGLEQTVCTMTVNFRAKSAPTYSCSDETSLNGQPLPVFKPVIRLG